MFAAQYTNRCLLKWLKLWDTVVFGKEKPVKKAKPGAEAHPSFKQPKEPQNKWKTKAQLTEEILEAELDQHKRPKYKVSRAGHRAHSRSVSQTPALERSSVCPFSSSTDPGEIFFHVSHLKIRRVFLLLFFV